MQSIALAVIGGRSFQDYACLSRHVQRLMGLYNVHTLVSGGASGTDRLAERFARENGLPMLVLLPDWSLGPGADLLRNKEIVEKADYVLAFWNKRSKGTSNTIQRAKKTGKRLRVVYYK
jgi:hypothetical protein